MKEYFKNLSICFLALLAMVLSWGMTLNGGVDAEPLILLIIATLIVVVGFFLRKVQFSYIGLIGHSMMLGALISIPTSLVAVVLPLFKGVNSFGGYFCAWIIMALIGNIGVGACVSGIKMGIQSLLRLNFYAFIICIMLFFSGIFVFINTITVSMKIANLLTFIVFISSIPGAWGASLVVKAPQQDTISDGHGNTLYVISNISEERVLASDGYNYRRMPDGNYHRM